MSDKLPIMSYASKTVFTKNERKRSKDTTPIVSNSKYTNLHTQFKEPNKCVLVVRIGAHLALPGLGAVVRAAVIR